MVIPAPRPLATDGERLDLHDAGMDEQRAAAGRCVVIHVPARRTCRAPAPDARPDLRLLVLVCSRHGGTAELASGMADGIGEAAGDRAAVAVRSASDVDDASDDDAVTTGSADIVGDWTRAAPELGERSAISLTERPVRLFSGGPVGEPGKPAAQVLHVGLLVGTSQARDRRLFAGRLDGRRSPLPERVLPAPVHAADGAFSNRPEIRRWGAGIGSTLGEEAAGSWR